MTDDEIIEIRDSLLPSQGEQFDQLAFGRAIAAAERDACVKIAEDAAERMREIALKHREDGNDSSMDRCNAKALQSMNIAADIRRSAL